MRRLMKFISRRYILICILGCILVALLLAGKNPFDDQSLIPNLEPYPDSLYYGYPAWNVTHGKDFSMTYQGAFHKNVTPPLFSLYLIPFFAVFGDVRAFYFAQLILLIVSTGLLAICLGLILDRVKASDKEKTILISIGTFLFVTNFYIYTMPSLLMAELMTITVFLVGCMLLLQPVTSRRIAIAAHIGMLLLLIKISNLPIAMVFYLVLVLKVWKSEERNTCLLHLLTASLYTGGYFYLSDFFQGHKNLQGGNFSIENLQHNLIFYIRALAGMQTRYLWYSERLVSSLLSVAAVCGVIAGLSVKELRKIVASVFLCTISLLVFMSFFVTPDARYISVLIPLYSCLIIIGFATLLKSLKYYLPVIILVLYLLVPAFSQQPPISELQLLKKQIGLNYLHPENPWNYNAVVEMDAHIGAQKSEKPIYIATFLPQFYVAMFVKNFIPLPITANQEFYSPDDEAQIELIHLKAFTAGTVYLSNAYAGNLSNVWPQEFEKMKEKYAGKLVYQGCLGSCNLYLLSNQEVSTQ